MSSTVASVSLQTMHASSGAGGGGMEPRIKEGEEDEDEEEEEAAVVSCVSCGCLSILCAGAEVEAAEGITACRPAVAWRGG